MQELNLETGISTVYCHNATTYNLTRELKLFYISDTCIYNR